MRLRKQLPEIKTIYIAVIYWHKLFVLFILLTPLLSYSQWSQKSLMKVTKNKEIYNNLHKSYTYLIKNSDTAHIYAQKALNNALKSKDMPAVCLSYAFLTHTELQTGEYLKALENLDNATSINNTLHIPELNAYIKYITATKYSKLGKIDDAIKQTTEALSIYEHLKDSTGIASLYKFIGILYLESGQHSNMMKAKLYITKALTIHNLTKDYSRIGSDFSLLGYTFSKLKQYDSANYYYLKGIDADRKNKNTRWLASSYLKLGELKSAIKEIDSAEHYLNLAKEEFINLGQFANMMYIYIEKAKLAGESQQYTKAQKFYTETYNLASKYHIAEIKSDALMGLYETAKTLGEYKIACSYLAQYIQVKDSISKDKNLSVFSLIEIQREYEIKKREMQLENDKVVFNSQRKNIYIVLLSAIALIIILILIVVYKYFKVRQRSLLLEKEKLKLDIEFKNKELTVNILSLVKKNEIFSEISQKLALMEKEESSDGTRLKLKMISKEVKDNVGKEIWEEFDMRFKQVHVEFYKNLIDKYPEMTSGELRLCAFLRLNLSTKEIAQLTGQNIKALEMARFRLRKKMGISDPDTNLVVFLSGL